MDFTGDYCRVHFRVKSFTKIGQSVAVSGSSSALGCFDKQKVVKLVTTPESYPVWFSKEPLILPRSSTVYYSYCIVEGNAVKAFENKEVRRVVSFSASEVDTVVEDEFLLDMLRQDNEALLLQELKEKTTIAAAEDRGLTTFADGRLFLICYHLPVNVKATGITSRPFEVAFNDSLIAKSAGSIAGTIKTMWMGTLSIDHSQLSDSEMSFLMTELEEMNCYPIFLERELTAAAYYGYCKTIMWPIFHNVDQLDQIHAAWNLGTNETSEPLNSPSVVGRGEAHSPPRPSTAGTATGVSSYASSAGAGFEMSSSPGVFNGDNIDINDLIKARRKTRSASVSSQTMAAGNKVLSWNKQEREFYQACWDVNQIFAFAVRKIAVPGDVLWCHDYHLIFLPQLLRDLFDAPDLPVKLGHCETPVMESTQIKIIFYMHIPFPTSQIFRTLPKGTEMLESMIQADLVGFHAFDHARHFLTACKRIIGVRSYSRPGGVVVLQSGQREVVVTMSHVGVEPEKLTAAMQSSEAQQITADILAKHRGKKIIVGIDICQRLSGLALKLAAFEKLLTDYSHSFNEEWAGVVLVQRCIRGGSRKDDERTTSQDIRKMVAEINAKFAYIHRQVSPGTGKFKGFGSSSTDVSVAPAMVIDYEECEKMDLHERVGVWMAGDVCVSTAIREGLNLSSLEYIYSRKDLPHAGVVVVSEFATSASLLNGAMKINPFSATGVADTLSKALNITKKAANIRRVRDLNFISTHPSSSWSTTIIKDLDIQMTQGKMALDSKNNFGKPSPLPLDQVLKAYENASSPVLSAIGSRVFIFDYTSSVKGQSDLYVQKEFGGFAISKPPKPAVLEALKTLSDDSRNVVMVTTGIGKHQIGNVFKGLDNVTIVTSDGLVYSWGRNLQNNAAIRVSLVGSSQGYINRAQSAGLPSTSTPLMVRAGSDQLSQSGHGGPGGGKDRSGSITQASAAVAALGQQLKTPAFDIYRRNYLADYDLGENENSDEEESDDYSSYDEDEDEDGDLFDTGTAGIASRRRRNSSESSEEGGEESLRVDDAGGPPMPSAAVLAGENPNSGISPSKRSPPPRALLEPTMSSYLKFATEDVTKLTNDSRNWQFMDCSIDWNAVSEIAMPILTKFSFRTNGTSVNPRIPGLGFNYSGSGYGADPDWGHKQAPQLQVELEAALANFDVKITSLTPGTLEIVPRSLNKGIMVQNLMQRVMARRGGQLPRFMAVFGGGPSDNILFETLYSVLAAAPPNAKMMDMKLFTVCSATTTSSSAQFHTTNTSEIPRLLESLAASDTTEAPSPPPVTTRSRANSRARELEF